MSVLLVGWLGCTVGMQIGTKVGAAMFVSENVRKFQSDLVDAAGQTDARSREVLLATANLAGQMADPSKYASASQDFAKMIQELQKDSSDGTLDSEPLAIPK